MDSQTLDRLRPAAIDCPSELDLDMLHNRELAAARAAELNDHVAGCLACQARLAARTSGFAAYDDVDPQALLAGIRDRLREKRAPKKPRSAWPALRRAAYFVTPLLAAATLAFVFFGRRPPLADSIGETVREKGGLILRVYKLDGNRAQPLISGDRVHPGDHLRFVADLPTAGHINVLGIEAGGALYVAWPSRADVPTLRGAGKLQELPGASALDDSRGRELLYLVHCPESLGSPATACQAQTSNPARAPLNCPPSCTLSPFILNKE